MNQQLFFELLINGAVVGSIYALMASGISLIWGTLRMLNFAHGEFYMLGGYFFYFLFAVLDIPAPIAILFTMMMTFFVGVMIEKIVIKPLLDKPGWEVSPMIATIGISIFLQNVALLLWSERFQNVPYIVDNIIVLGGMRIAQQRLIILLGAFLVIIIGSFLLKYTRLGMAIRATAQDRDVALMMGVNVHFIYTITLAISAMLAALAATLLSPIYSVNPWMGISLLLKGFIVCVLGGLGSLEGAILGGIFLGIAENFTVIIFSSEWMDIIAFLFLLIVLWFRPSGLLGKKEY